MMPIRSTAAVSAVLSLVLVILISDALAAAGDLDPTFGGDGKVVTDAAFDGAASVAIQGDRKIVAAGQASGSTDRNLADFGLARYNPDGTLDPTFHGDGRRTTEFGGDTPFGDFDLARDVTIQEDDKVLAVGCADCIEIEHIDARFALARYNTDGSLDDSFGGNGKVTTKFGAAYADASAVVLDAEGRIVVVGAVNAGGSLDLALARYAVDGQLDDTLSGDGKVVTDLRGDDAASGVAIQADGKIVVAGGSDGDFAVARYKPNGTLDMGFSGDGWVTASFGSGSFDSAADVALQPNGRIVVAGQADSFSAFAVARFTGDGTLDTTFSGNGKARTFVGFSQAATSLVIQEGGEIVVAGGAQPTGRFRTDFALARYRRNGLLDETFGGGDGRVLTNFSEDDFGNAVALQANGKIVAAGTTGRGDFGLARYLAA
jgi:uncharacterized delta-60 repeat protein